MPYYCPTCAHTVRKNDRFCSACGTSMPDGPIYAQSKADLIDIEDLQHPVSVQTVGDRQYERQTQYSEPYQETQTFQEEPRATYHYTQNNYYQENSTPRYKQYMPMRNKYVAAFLAFFFGTLGLHEFYLDHAAKGILMLCFCWTGVPTFMGFIQAIIYLTQGDEEFCFKNRVRVR